MHTGQAEEVPGRADRDQDLQREGAGKQIIKHNIFITITITIHIAINVDRPHAAKLNYQQLTCEREGAGRARGQDEGRG